MDNKIILYTIRCPSCTVLAAKLDKKGIQYEIVDSVDEMKALGIKSAPALGVDGKILSFPEAVKWVNGQ